VRIERGTVVTLAYELKDADGEPLEDSGATLQDKEVGHEVSLTLEPDDAFGDYDAELLRVEPRNRFPEELQVGMQFEGVPGEDEEAAHIYTVTDIAADQVVVDANHPYAGERVWFKCAVTAVRKATREELAHGHAHEDPGLHTH
jgi:FKBP-type peptidyl-prolyl cis-trans isomerase SlyD